VKKEGAARLLFARNLRVVREALGISQEELGFRSGLHRTYISVVEKGDTNISINNMEKLANAVETPLRDLLTNGWKPLP
jgi:transcriptional regulator with XRE-family HTH domain